MTRRRGIPAVLLMGAALAPSAVQAQAPKAGVVTTLEGNVTATRSAAPQPVALKFKDDIFLQDRIATGDQSLARMLLGGKAVVTVRERSVVTITEIPGRSTIEIDSGKFALSVARERMRPGEIIEIRTPNAIAGVRGSVIVTEVEPAPGAGAATLSNLYVLRGTLDAQGRDPSTGAPLGTPQTLTVLQQFQVAGTGAPVVSPIRPEQLPGIRAGLQPRSLSHGDAGNPMLSNQAMQTAVALATTIAPSQLVNTAPGSVPLPSVANSTNTVAPLQPPVAEARQEFLASQQGSQTGVISGPVSLVDGGFESGAFTGWTLSGAGAVVSSFGNLTPPQGQFMGLIHTDTNVTLSGCGPGADCTRSTLSQPFQVSSVVSVSAKGFLLSNEFPTFTSTNSTFNDRFLLQIIDSAGQTLTLFDQRVNETSFTAAPASATAAGFTLSQGAGQAPFELVNKTVVAAAGPATLQASVSNVSDTALDSAFILDAVAITQDPPRFFLTRGTHAAAGTLASFAGATDTFDSLLLVCCGASASLAGPALSARNSDLTLPFGVVTAIQGGTITSTGAGPLVELAGGRYTLGSIISVFDVAGLAPTDEPLRHAGPFLEASGAMVQTGNVMRVDSALLAATAPLLALRNSVLVANDSALQLTFRANVTSLGPLFTLDRSVLVVDRGALVNVTGASALRVQGDLVRLANGSTLVLRDGPLARVTGNSLLSVSGALVGFSGPGNALSVGNNLCASLACTNIGGIPVALTGGATAANVSVSNPITGTGSVSFAPNAAAIVVSGAASQVTVGK